MPAVKRPAYLSVTAKLGESTTRGPRLTGMPR